MALQRSTDVKIQLGLQFQCCSYFTKSHHNSIFFSHQTSHLFTRTVNFEVLWQNDCPNYAVQSGQTLQQHVSRFTTGMNGGLCAKVMSTQIALHDMTRSDVPSESLERHARRVRDVALGRGGLRRPETRRQDAHEQIHVVQIGLKREKTPLQ